MSEEAKEKAGGGKATHRKKKGKKVREKLSVFKCLTVVCEIYFLFVKEKNK